MSPIVISTFEKAANMLGVSLIVKLIVRGSEDMWTFFLTHWTYNVLYMYDDQGVQKDSFSYPINFSCVLNSLNYIVQTT